MKILFTGDYLTDYNRTLIIKHGLKKIGHEVIEFSFQNKSRETRKKILELAQDCDFIFMPSFTHQEVSFVRRVVGPHKKIIFDPLISRYLTKVFDYKLVSRYSLSALRNFYRDKWSMQAADFVVTDTKAHLEYFHKEFGIAREKMGVLYIGNDFTEYYPKPVGGSDESRLKQAVESKSKSPEEGGIVAPLPASASESLSVKPKVAKKFRVGFYGGFIPLQGVMNILGAAKLLNDKSDIEFELIGTGFEFEAAQKYVETHKLKNVIMPGWVKPPQLREHIQDFDVALGIFGDSEKSDLVIPNKVFHYAACAKAIITKSSPAMREIFVDLEDLLLISTTPADIARQIMRLKSDAALRTKLGQNILNKMQSHYTDVNIAQKLIEYWRAL